ncbi:hypothetical protein ACQY0O_007283 [Thecaphora frezii]
MARTKTRGKGRRGGATSTRGTHRRKGLDCGDAPPASEPLDLDYGSSEANPITIEDDDPDHDATQPVSAPGPTDVQQQQPGNGAGVRPSSPAAVCPTALAPTESVPQQSEVPPSSDREEGELSDGEAQIGSTAEAPPPQDLAVKLASPVAPHVVGASQNPTNGYFASPPIAPRTAGAPTYSAAPHLGSLPQQEIPWTSPSTSRYAAGPYGFDVDAPQPPADAHYHPNPEDWQQYGWRAGPPFYPPPPPLPPADLGYANHSWPDDYSAQATSSRQQLSPYAHPYHPRSHQQWSPHYNASWTEPQAPADPGRKRKTVSRDSHANTFASLSEPPAKLLKRKKARSRKAETSAVPFAEANQSRVPQTNRSSAGSSKSWTDKEKEEALELVAKLAACGMPPSRLISEGVNPRIVQTCCEELGIPLDGNVGVTKPDPSVEVPAPLSSSGIPEQTPAAGSTTATAAQEPTASSSRGVDPASELRQAALATLRRKAVASRAAKVKEEIDKDPAARPAAVQMLLLQAQQNAMLNGEGSRPSSPVYEPPEPESDSEVALHTGEKAAFASGHQCSDEDMALETSESEADPTETIKTKVRSYRDVDAPTSEQSIDLDFGSTAVPPARRQQISYADAFSRKPDTPAGEVDLDAPLPSLAAPATAPTNLETSASLRGRDHFDGQPAGFADTVPRQAAQSQAPAGVLAHGPRRRRPVAADFDEMPSFSHQSEAPRRRVQFFRQPYRTRLIIEVSDDDDDDNYNNLDDDEEERCTSRTAACAAVRRHTMQAIYALYLAERGLAVPSSTTTQALEARSGKALDTPHGAVTPTRKEGSQPTAASTPKADTPNEELLKKEQDIKLLLQRIKALERKKSSNGSPSASSSIAACSVPSEPSKPSTGEGRVDVASQAERFPASEKINGASSRPSEITAPAVVEPAASKLSSETASTGLQLDPKLQLQREKLLASLKQKKAAVEARNRQSAAPAVVEPDPAPLSQPLDGDAQVSASPQIHKTESSAADGVGASGDTQTASQEVEGQSLPTASTPQVSPPHTSSLLQNMTERFKAYISPFTRFSGFRSLTAGRSASATIGSATVAPSNPSEGVRDGPTIPIKKRWCPAEANGSRCDAPECRMAHVRDYDKALAVEPFDQIDGNGAEPS